MEGVLQETPAQLGITSSAAWQKLYLNTLVGLMTFCGFCGMEKHIFFSEWNAICSSKESLAFCCLPAFLSEHGGDSGTCMMLETNLGLLTLLFCMPYYKISLGNQCIIYLNLYLKCKTFHVVTGIFA